MKSFFHYILQFTWGLVQNLIGLVVFLIFLARGKYAGKHKDAFVCKTKKITGICLGLFIFVRNPDNEYIVKHEYGHTLQSLILGVFWLFVIALPGLIWAALKQTVLKNRGMNYYDFYTEKWANRWGGNI